MDSKSKWHIGSETSNVLKVYGQTFAARCRYQSDKYSSLYHQHSGVDVPLESIEGSKCLLSWSFLRSSSVTAVALAHAEAATIISVSGYPAHDMLIMVRCLAECGVEVLIQLCGLCFGSQRPGCNAL
jgi:hypothetical protein